MSSPKRRHQDNGKAKTQRDLSPLTGLTSLQNLDLSWCKQLKGDLSPLAGLTSLRRLDLSYCEKLSGDTSLLAGLTPLKSLCRFAPLESLLPTLKDLDLAASLMICPLKSAAITEMLSPAPCALARSFRARARLPANRCADSDKPRKAPNGVMRQANGDNKILPALSSQPKQ